MLLDINSRFSTTCNQGKNKQKPHKAHSFLNLELEVRGILALVRLDVHVVYLPRVKAQIIPTSELHPLSFKATKDNFQLVHCKYKD
jgi:hypothetical protein